jgi:hypothetical protein
MEATQYYGACLGLLFLIFTLLRNFPRNLLPNVAVKHAPYRRIRHLHGSMNITWLEAIFMVIHFTGNVVFLAIESKDWAKFSRYSGTLSVINALPLSLSQRSGLLRAMTWVRVHRDVVLHRYMGSMVFFEALVHVITITTTQRLALHTRVNITGLAVR